MNRQPVPITIRKADWLAAQQCPVMAWHDLRPSTSPPPDEAALFWRQQGHEIGELAQKLYPEGVLVSKELRKTTEQLVADETIETFFELPFRAGALVARPDIVRRHGDGWHLLEVKSSFADKKSDGLVDDLAYTVMVARRAGLSVQKASLVLVSRSYFKGQGPEQLFEVIDATQAVEARVLEFEREADEIVDALLADEPPPPVLVSACRSCDYFADTCLGNGIAHSVFELPNLSSKKLDILSAAGVVDLSLLPEDLELTERQRRVRDAALDGQPFIGPGLANALAEIKWPCRYLDFETVMTPLPLYDGHGCHQQVLTQFSVHCCSGIGAGVEHTDFLSDPTQDCERELAVSLIDALGSSGSILMYSSFEQTRIRALGDAFPDLAEPLEEICGRLVDLKTIIESHVYHPQFRGKFSIKKVLPALVSELSYTDLAIGNGSTAIVRFARMARGEISGEAIATTRQQLLEYCRMDTYAMVGLHEALHAYVPQRRAAGAS